MRRGLDELTDCITAVREGHTEHLALEAVLTAAEILVDMMASCPSVEWCDEHRRPYEFCGVVADTGCRMVERVLGPVVVYER